MVYIILNNRKIRKRDERVTQLLTFCFLIKIFGQKRKKEFIKNLLSLVRRNFYFFSLILKGGEIIYEV
jgi:hypothetical protein